MVSNLLNHCRFVSALVYCCRWFLGHQNVINASFSSSEGGKGGTYDSLAHEVNHTPLPPFAGGKTRIDYVLMSQKTSAWTETFTVN
jgi:hypothetical protein